MEIKGKDLLRKWQKKLGLLDWTIVLIDNCLSSDFATADGKSGECEMDFVHKCAVVRIVNPALYGQRIIPFNYEHTLVHELLHIKFGLIDNSGNDIHDIIVHQLIEEFAKLLTDKEK